MWRQNSELLLLDAVVRMCILNYQALKDYDVCTNRITLKASFLVKFHTEFWKLSMYIAQSFLSRFLPIQTLNNCIFLAT